MTRVFRLLHVHQVLGSAPTPGRMPCHDGGTSSDWPSTERRLRRFVWARAAVGGRRAWWFAVVGLVVAGTAIAAGIGVAATGGATSRSRPSSYCAVARAYDDARTGSADQRAGLLDQVAGLAPHDIAPTVRVLRTSPAGSHRRTAALQAWNRFNTNHCCDCIGGPNVPQTLPTRPPT